jgi:AcrR family transcriptional regulator
MARRKDHNREEIKKLAILAGLDILQQEDLKALSARAIANKIGYTVGTLYNVFKNFDEIVLYLNGETMDAMLRDFQQEKDIYRLIEIYIQFAHTHSAAWRLLFEFKRLEDDIPTWYHQKINTLFQWIETTLLPYVGNSPTQASMTAKVLWASLYGICFLSLNGKLNTILGETAHSLAFALTKNYLARVSNNLLQAQV